MVITMAKLRMAHARTHGARKNAWRMQAAWANKFSHTGVSPKWVKSKRRREREKEIPKVSNNNGQLRIATQPRVAHAKLTGPMEFDDVSH